jgi:hypothetical protein
MSDENEDELIITERLCDERVMRIEGKVDNLSTVVITNMASIKEHFELVVENHKGYIEKHEEEIDDTKEKVSELRTEIGMMQQWKNNGERYTDVWYKRQGVVVSAAVLFVSIIFNLDKVAAAGKYVVTAIGIIQ